MNNYNIITDSVYKKRITRLENLLKDENIIEVKKIENKYLIYYNNGCLFKCAGKLPDECIKVFFKRTNKKSNIVKLF